MPKLTFTNTRGLVQESGSGEFNLSGEATLYGDKAKVHGSILVGANALTASVASSGTTFILGSQGATDSVALPAMTSDNVGFKCTLVVTGALHGASHVVQTIDTTGASSTSDRFLLAVTALDGTETDKVTTSANKLTIVNGCADADDACVLDVLYIAANKALVKGIVLT